MNISSSRGSASRSRDYDRNELALRTVAVTVAAQVWPLLAFLGFLLAAALAWSAKSGDGVFTELAWWPFKAATLGLMASFALHESAHVMVLKRIRTVTHITIDRTAWRTSIVPAGALPGRQAVAVALAGPLSCVVLGTVLWVSGLDQTLSYWYLAHAIFLLPFFGDGRSLLRGLLAWHGVVTLNPER